MTHRSPAFEAYADRAREGKLGLWRFLFGLLAIAVVSVAAFVAVFVIWAVIITVPAMMETGVAPSESEIQAGIESMLYGQTPGEVTFLLLAWAGLWLGVWAAVQWFQGRKLRTVIAARPGMFWSDFVRASIAMFVASAAVALASFVLAPGSTARTSLSVSEWVGWLLPVAGATLVQTSAEEVVFRGYMTQTLAARSRSPWIWAAIPIASFVAIHFSSSFSATTNVTVVVFAAVFGSAATLLVWHTGNLGAAMGLHFFNNLMAFIFVGGGEMFGGAALFTDTLSGWSQVFLALTSAIVALGIALLLLFEPRSPLRLRSLDSFSSPPSAANFGG